MTVSNSNSDPTAPAASTAQRRSVTISTEKDEAAMEDTARGKDISEKSGISEAPAQAPITPADDDDESDAKSDDSEYVGMRMRDLEGTTPKVSVYKREKWWQLWRPRHAPPPPKASLADASELPLASANFVSKMTFHWVSPLMRLGYQRPLQATDLWKVDPSREADHLSAMFIENLEKRQVKAALWNDELPTAEPKWTKRASWTVSAAFHRHLALEFSKYGKDDTFSHRRDTLEAEWRQKSGKQRGSVTWALNETFPHFWWGGLYKVIADMAQLMGPLVVKEIIKFSQKMYAAHHGSGPEPNIGRGVGMAIGLFCLTITQSICQHQFFFRSMHTGAMARAALISATYKRAVNLSVASRSKHPTGRLNAYLSSDISRVDYCAAWFHAIWTAPIQLLVCLILLLVQIGPSALVGFAVFILLAPLQTYFMRTTFKTRQKSMIWTDGRSKLLQELLSSMQIIKVFTYEIPFLKRLAFVRRKEMVAVRKILMIRAGNQALAFSVPVIAAVLSFVTYSSTHPRMDPAIIFTSLAFFNLLRQPLMFLPRALSTLTDAQTAVQRLQDLFEAELTDDSNHINPKLDVAIRVKDASFQWTTVSGPEQPEPSKGRGKKKEKKREAEAKIAEEEKVLEGEPFAIEHLNLEVPRGKLVAIVGPVGSGKSSLLQGLIGEMRRKAGLVEFGGRLGYCQQSAWIQNATLRDNVVFGQKWDESRYWKCIQDASLVTDLEILPDGDLTEIGEKGVTLSGGQKQRVNIARALYFDADIDLFDDPLSAVDAHVGKALFNDAILGLRRQGKTIVLVTHALHFLPQVDYIYTVDHGRIVEEGTFSDLMASGGAFKRLMDEFGGSTAAKEEGEAADEEDAIEEITLSGEKAKTNEQKLAKLTRKQMGKAAGTGKLEGRLMVSEVRKTGAVGRKVYGAYLKAGRAYFTAPATIFFAVIMQGAQIMSTVWLTYWEEDKFHKPNGFYQGIYAMLGIASALFTFGLGSSMGIMSYFASNNLYKNALRRVFFSPMSFFDTQPLGRIQGVLGKDIDTVDNQLADALRMQAMTLITLIGSVTIITVYFHYFIAIIFVVGIGYWYFALFYRTSAREVKRLDSMLRSLLYSHFSESLSGRATIKAYGETGRFIKENAYYMDLEDRAYLLTASNQRWLAIRLDFLGACLVFAVAVMATKGGGGLSPAQIALSLTYMQSVTQVFGMLTRQSAEVENSMNAVERIRHYSDGSLPQEKPYEIDETKPKNDWPSEGTIKFDKVVMSYRKELPPVLKGISAEFKHGEKVGIIGRTGAGKTSITVALFRLAELSSGRITIDDVDISTLGLKDLRSSIAIIPQDPVLFSGTLRSNLDPFEQYDDARLYDAMKRACLDGEIADESGSRKRFTLDMAIDDEGSNLSIGERSLVSLARALVKDAPIVVLDEATAAVDLATDSQIQETIRSEFGGKTLLCIAHRLRTIISWDRIVVMNAGEIEDFDTPLTLYDNEHGLFRTMCDRSNITREEIIRARKEEAF